MALQTSNSGPKRCTFRTWHNITDTQYNIHIAYTMHVQSSGKHIISQIIKQSFKVEHTVSLPGRAVNVYPPSVG